MRTLITQFETPWIDCLCTFAACDEVGGSIVDDAQQSLHLELIVHVPQNCSSPRRGTSQSAAKRSLLPLTVAVCAQHSQQAIAEVGFEVTPTVLVRVCLGIALLYLVLVIMVGNTL